VPHRRHRFSGCSHKGFGAFCHRCAEATKLEAALPKTINEKFNQMKAEIERLRAPAVKKTRYTQQAPEEGA
jgi:hypothetical protein